MKTVDIVYRQPKPWKWNADKNADVYVDGKYEGTHWMKCGEEALVKWLKEKLGVKRIHRRRFFVPRNEQAIRMKAHDFILENAAPWDIDPEYYRNDPFDSVATVNEIADWIETDFDGPAELVAALRAC